MASLIFCNRSRTLLCHSVAFWQSSPVKNCRVGVAFSDFELNMSDPFLTILQQVCDPISHDSQVSRGLTTINQDNRFVTDYAIYFSTLVSAGAWNDPTQRDMFNSGLTLILKDELAT